MPKRPLVYAIIPAGGIGKRMKSTQPKQFMTLDNEPILLVTLRALAASGLIEKFVIPTIDLVYTKRIIKSACPELDCTVIKGGKTRQDSVYNALQVIKRMKPKPSLILVHDAVRALIKKATVEKIIERAAISGAAIAASPIFETIKLARKFKNQNLIKKNVSREDMWLAQTPQVFKTDIIMEAYEKAKQEHFVGTDSSGLVERLGLDVHLLRSPRSNIKITVPEDLDFAKVYLQIEKK